MIISFLFMCGRAIYVAGFFGFIDIGIYILIFLLPGYFVYYLLVATKAIESNHERSDDDNIRAGEYLEENMN